MKCLLLVLAAFSAVLAFGAVMYILRYFFRPVFRLVELYWDWCLETFQDEFTQTLFAVTPVIAVFLALIVLVVCLV